jgi:UDP-4-amino-4,6-dideoxy-N-acetyl-beta-L-altrosamine N-acetyltransferase
MLRPLEKSDLELILRWRNAPTARKAMFSQHEISLEEHRAWFQRIQEDDTQQWFLFLDDDGFPSAVVNFIQIDQVQKKAFWGFYTKPESKRGTGLRMSLEALDKAFDNMGLEKINAEVLGSNLRSLDMHKKVGFIQEGCFRKHFLDGRKSVDVVRFGLLQKEWAQAKINLVDRISQGDSLNRNSVID